MNTWLELLVVKISTARCEAHHVTVNDEIGIINFLLIKLKKGALQKRMAMLVGDFIHHGGIPWFVNGSSRLLVPVLQDTRRRSSHTSSIPFGVFLKMPPVAIVKGGTIGHAYIQP